MNFTVAKLAERWECSKPAIYGLIKAGKLAHFSVGDPDRPGSGKKRLSGIRITEEEVLRWEGKGRPTVPETAPSDDEDETGLPSIQMRALANAGG